MSIQQPAQARSGTPPVTLRLAAAALGLLASCPACALLPTRAPLATPPASTASATDEDLLVDPLRSLALTCSGEGEPAVIYLHGLVRSSADAVRVHQVVLRSRVERTTRYCEYERTGVGRSSPAQGPIHMQQAVDDLDLVVDRARLTGPVVLVGSDFGGLLAYTYASAKPDRVAGLVLVDPRLPNSSGPDDTSDPDDGGASLSASASPTESRPEAGNEPIDLRSAETAARRALATNSRTPGALFVSGVRASTPEPARLAIQAEQARLAAHLHPGATQTVTAANNLLDTAPDAVASATLALVDRSR